MKKIAFILFASFISLCSYAETVHLDDAFVFATESEMKDLPSLLKQIDLSPAGTDEKGNSLLKVERVSKGSVFDRMGIKAGDIVQAQDTSVRPTEDSFESSLQ